MKRLMCYILIVGVLGIPSITSAEGLDGKEFGAGLNFDFFHNKDFSWSVFCERVNKGLAFPIVSYRLDGKETTVGVCVLSNLGSGKWLKTTGGWDMGAKYVVAGERQGQALFYFQSKVYLLLK